MKEELIAPCGINCAVCNMYLNRQRGLYKTKTAGCIGCIPRGTGCKIHGGCDPINTAIVRFCNECNDYPCRVIESLEKRYSSKYHTSIKDNLQYIRDKAITAFLEAETEKWTCRRCGGIVTMHSGVCADCGEPFTE